ncbi:mRNA-decapping enzyme 1B isoform X1 [Alexandromys fortis]|uniref:mRNA-decapping enzyme 1B isoform X1 n=2 Tax=Alexandromys fortis TaxID=100897 RepID=UPI002152ED50|nr:mRNA-decapping enzyme 1B isoform X1 [Microtus fortis]
MAATAAGGLPGKGHDISLAALQRHDPYISRIVDVASQVALYTFFHRANKWEKTDVEGTLFVYTRSASPKHGFTIMNRLSMENRTEPITKDLDLQLQDPFLLYRNATLSIYGIWFYDKEECQRIAKLMKNLTQCEQLKACHGAGAGSSPVSLSSGEGREVDILQMLTKAKDEYTKCKSCSEPKQMTSSSAICDNPKLIKPVPVRPSSSQRLQEPLPNKTSDPEPQHLSLTALFGKQDKAPCHETLKSSQTFVHHHHHHLHHHQHQQQEQLLVHQGVACSLPYEEPRKLSLPVEKQLCPAIQKLMVGSTRLHLLPQHPEQWLCESGSPSRVGGVPPCPVQLGSPWNGRTACCAQSTARCAQSTCRNHKLLEQLQGASGAAHKCKPCAPARLSAATQVTPGQNAAPSQLVYFGGPLPPPTPGHEALRKEQCALPAHALPFSGSQKSSPSVLPTQELLRKLQAVHQEQQLQAVPRPALAARFPVSAQGSGTEKPLEAWASKTSSMEKQAPSLQITSAQCVPAPVTSLLMPPVVFTQSTCAPLRETESGLMPLGGQELPAASSSLLLPLQNWESSTVASRPLTRLQLQEALLNLIQNDDSFLSIIYETYLFSVTQAAMRKAT